jgi:DNA mismatch repair protein MutS
MGSLYDEYEEYTKKYQAEYGANAIVLYRCGSFYEIYSINDGLINIKSISELLNIQVSRRNKAILNVDRSNCNMAGFPMFALKKFVNILVDNSYTVVIVDQVSSPPKPKRAVTEIISPGTRIDSVATFENNMLFIVVLEEHDIWRQNKTLMTIGISMIDLSTGKSKTVEFYSKDDDAELALDELFKLIVFYYPKEIILTSAKPIKYEFHQLVNYLEISSACVHDKMGLLSSTMTNCIYQEQFLRKIFPNHGLLSVFEYLELERLPLATVSYVYMLEFAHKHNEHIIKNISVPEIIKENQNLVLSYNTCKQLNISELCTILNHCETAIGKRNFKDRLVNPMICPGKIQESYDTIHKYKDFYKDTTKSLNKIYDLERLCRKMILKKLHPADFLQIHESLEAIIELQKWVSIGAGTSNIKEMQTFYINVLDMTEIQKYHLDNINGSFFITGVYPEIDNLHDELIKSKGIFEILANNITNCKVDYNERDGFYLSITAKRFQDMKQELKGKKVKIYDYVFELDKLISKSISASSTVLRLTDTHIMKKINQDIIDLEYKLNLEVLQKYQTFVSTFINTYNFEPIIKYISEVDWYTSCAKCVDLYRYTRPIIAERTERDECFGASYMNAEAIRHPIIERILTSTCYIPNDISIGAGENQGILLYGVNSAGKSSLSKAIGLCIIMAQAGMYVPCDKFTYWPYNEIFTRIPSGDDMMKGQSTFVVEMSELRNILKRASMNSLIVGDEIAGGSTESISALAIVTAAILQLYKKNATFMFATHLHDLCDIEAIKKLDRLGIFNLSVKYDADSKKLIYDRILKSGQGDTLYGLEVCKSLNLGEEFLDIANTVRQELLNIPKSVYSQKTSRYNSKFFIDTCSICKKEATEVHHIQQQALADDKGFINHMHKNNLANLMAVCDTCHDKIHNDEIKIDGYHQTSDGIELISHVVEDNAAKSDDEIKTAIKNLRKSGDSYNKIADKLGISLYKVKKYINTI